MKYTIIEDCSPFYIRFTHDGIDDFLNTAYQAMPDITYFPKWFHYNLSNQNKPLSDLLLEKTPVSQDLDLQSLRVSYFVSGAGLYYRAHKDGYPGDRYSINYPVLVQDDKCITSWYSDADLEHYPIDRLPKKNSRECIGFDKTKHTPLKSMIAKTGECILFNTDIFHDWDNTESTNQRVVLTLRHRLPENFYFEDARKALFGY